MSHSSTWRKHIPGSRKNKCKGPEAGVCLECLRGSGWSTRREPRVTGNDIRGKVYWHTRKDSVGKMGILDFILSEVRSLWREGHSILQRMPLVAMENCKGQEW